MGGEGRGGEEEGPLRLRGPLKNACSVGCLFFL